MAVATLAAVVMTAWSACRRSAGAACFLPEGAVEMQEFDRIRASARADGTLRRSLNRRYRVREMKGKCDGQDRRPAFAANLALARSEQ
jgi:hypothetical protein